MSKKDTKRTIGVYRSYNFKNFDPVIDKMRTVVEDSGQTYKRVSEDSGVSRTTLGNWFNGRTRRPQFATVNAVARALGSEFRLMPMAVNSTRRAKPAAQPQPQA